MLLSEPAEVFRRVRQKSHTTKRTQQILNNKQNAPRTIFHAHNMSLERIIDEIPALKEAGFDAIQTSPLQESPQGEGWFLRYQPWNHLKIDGLGNEETLYRLCAKATSLDMMIIADIVFNHMAVPDGALRNDWITAFNEASKGNQRPLEALYKKLDSYPNLNRDDFMPWRDMQGEDWDNINRYESWGNGEWPELVPNDKVIGIHMQHLDCLYKAGVKGFRFDAVKHMRPEHLEKYVRFFHSQDKLVWIYGEVLSDRLKMHQEYTHIFPTTDFCFVRSLKNHLDSKEANRVGFKFTIDTEVDFISPNSIRFAINHDLALNDPKLMSGLLFRSQEMTNLASALVLLIESGTCLVFNELLEPNSLQAECISFRSHSKGMQGKILVQRSEETWTIKSLDSEFTVDCRENLPKSQIKLNVRQS